MKSAKWFIVGGSLAVAAICLASLQLWSAPNANQIIAQALGSTIKAFSLQNLDINGLQGAAASGRPFNLSATKKGGGLGSKSVQVTALDDLGTKKEALGIDQTGTQTQIQRGATIKGFSGQVVGSPGSEVTIFTDQSSKFVASSIQDSDGYFFQESVDELLKGKGVSASDRAVVAASGNVIAYNGADLVLDKPIDNDALNAPSGPLGLAAMGAVAQPASEHAVEDAAQGSGTCRLAPIVLVADAAYQALYPWPQWYNRLYSMFWSEPYGMRHTFFSHQDGFCIDHRPPSDGYLIWYVSYNLSTDACSPATTSALNTATSVNISFFNARYGVRTTSQWNAGNGFTGGVLGCAWVGTIGTKYAVNVISGLCSSSSTTMCSQYNGMQVSQHEEGHTFGGNHVNLTLTGAPMHPDMSGYSRLATYINPALGIPFFCRFFYDGVSAPANDLEANCQIMRSLSISRLLPR